MRLCKPKLHTKAILPTCPEAAPPSLNNDAVGSGGQLLVARENDFALSSTLKLPESFGNIYLGETFTAYISVLNQLQSKDLINASLSAKLQSPTDRAELVDVRMARGASTARANPTAALHPSENLDMIVEHTLKELGKHTLRVTVKFSTLDAPEGTKPRIVRKFYLFSVLNPIGIKIGCLPIKGRPFVEMHLMNNTQVRC
ncbi:unnamed protein product [Choristocarpus tenellus]